MDFLEYLKEKKVIIYGAGFCGLMFSDLLIDNGIRPVFFWDKNKKLNGRKFNNIKIVSPYIKEDKDVSIIVCILDYDLCCSIKAELITRGYTEVVHVYELCYEKELFEKQPLIFYVEDNWIKDNKEYLEIVYDMLEDRLSKLVFTNIIKFITTDITTPIPHGDIKEQYFDYDIYKKIDGEIFVDCGAYNGQIMEYFIENTQGRFCKYIAIEPDPMNCIEITKKTTYKNNMERIEIVSSALSDKREELYIRNYLNTNSLITKGGGWKRTLHLLLMQILLIIYY